MDSSDVTKRRKQQAIFVDKQNTFVAKNPTGDCANLRNCCGTTSSCIRNFQSFDEKYSFFKGRNACVTGSAPLGDFAFGVTGCQYAVNGGGR